MSGRLPPWLRKPIRDHERVQALHRRLRGKNLHTVCEEARCPNIGECFSRNMATFLLMGPNCSRNCGFCNIGSGPLAPLDPDEPKNVASAAAEMQLVHVVITSVTRDDLPLGGAEHFFLTVVEVKKALPKATIEVLTPDFGGNREALQKIAAAPIDVFNHNMETVARLYSKVRAPADYRQSLDVLRAMAQLRPDTIIKSGLMLGLGETDDEVHVVLQDLRSANTTALTMGQYLRPRLANLPVERYVEPEAFAEWQKTALALGFSRVAAAPLVRSSYLADRLMHDGQPLAETPVNGDKLID